MTKNIDKDDILFIKKLLEKVYKSNSYKYINRMGGLTNHTYKITLDNEDIIVVRVPGKGTEAMINRKYEMISNKLACDLGIDSNLIYFEEDGTKITKFIPNAITLNSDLIKKSENIKSVAEILKTLHSCDVDTKVPFEVFEMAENYEKIITEKNVPMFEDYKQVKDDVIKVKSEIDSTYNIKKVPCHNDPLCENWIIGNDKMYLIDWEYAGMNDGMWDVADVSIEARFSNKEDMLILENYLGFIPTNKEIKHFIANKIYVDYLWTLWAKTRVPYDGEYMENWATERYNRLKVFINQYKEISK